ncbi:MAG: acetylxylan esterase [Bryobacteraceae bacterium]|nr:acetylxylan esterase [Bryobacteraceae bacterium]
MRQTGVLRLAVILFLSAIGGYQVTGAETWKGNHDESNVKSYTLSDPLTLLNGKKVRNADEWKKLRRPEILHLFEDNVYGKTPSVAIKPHFDVISTDRDALGGKAVRKEVTISFVGHDGGPKIHLLLYLPRGAKGAVPVFTGLNFGGNHTVSKDPGITIANVWLKGRLQRADEETRGQSVSRWPVERILARGYGVATAYYGDIEPDFDGGMEHGVRRMFRSEGQPDQGNNWAAIGSWAWGLGRIADYLVTDKDVDSKRLVLTGHSRLGKAALWAGAQDERFAIVISNNSGEGGAALSKRNFGEDVWRINNSFPHWFARNYRKYSNKESDLPIDQHMLLALIAPRPLYVASAAEDLHADPRGEFLSAVNAGPVYELLGKKGLGTDGMPGIDKPIMKTIAYHIRAGKHDMTDYDWDRYLDFADRQWARQ